MDEKELKIDMSKPYTFRFKGGPSDGLCVQTDAESAGEQQEAFKVLALTHSATVGGGMWGNAPGVPVEHFLRNVVRTQKGPVMIGSPPQAHEYRVTERREEDGRVFAVLEYKGLKT
jgi:hypothetical protein